MAPADNRQNERHLVRGMLAGAAGGLAASFVMNQFHEGLIDLPETPPADDPITRVLALKTKSGPGVHYALASAIGALYGASFECSPVACTGFGTFLASAIFVGADARKLLRSGLHLLS